MQHTPFEFTRPFIILQLDLRHNWHNL